MCCLATQKRSLTAFSKSKDILFTVRYLSFFLLSGLCPRKYAAWKAKPVIQLLKAKLTVNLLCTCLYQVLLHSSPLRSQRKCQHVCFLGRATSPSTFKRLKTSLRLKAATRRRQTKVIQIHAPVVLGRGSSSRIFMQRPFLPSSPCCSRTFYP